MHPRVRMFLTERDRARARGDAGVVRATTADLRRLGVPDTATLLDPSGSNGARRTQPQAARGGAKRASRKCEHGAIPDHCAECNEELVAK